MKERIDLVVASIRRWVSASVALAGALCLVLTPRQVPGGAGPARAAAPSSPPFRGTSETTFLQLPDGGPTRTVDDLGSYVETSAWSVTDPGHFRVELRTLSPALEAGVQKVVANGTTLLWYDNRVAAAIRGPLGSVSNFAVLGLFQGGTPVSLAQMRGLGIVEYYTSNGGSGKVLAQEHVLGRTADVVEVSPVVLERSETCPQGKPCTVTYKSFGTERIWFDHELGIVLRDEQYGIPVSTGFAANYLYRVTSLTVGAGASPTDLMYKPPVRIKGPPQSQGGSIQTGKRLNVPRGFVSFTAPRGYSLHAQPQGTSPLTGSTYSFSALFTRSYHFFYVQERIHINGMPSELKKGPPVQAGKCRAWVGTYSDGLRWLSFQKGHITVLVTTDSLSASALKRWAATTACRN